MNFMRPYCKFNKGNVFEQESCIISHIFRFIVDVKETDVRNTGSVIFLEGKTKVQHRELRVRSILNAVSSF